MQRKQKSVSKMTKQVDNSEIAKRASIQTMYVDGIGPVKTVIDLGYNGGCACQYWHQYKFLL